MKAVCHKAGFTLIEVCLAVLVIGIGLLSVFSLFPSGLRSVEDDKADTRCGLFADTVLNGLRGNAGDLDRWEAWTNSGVADDLRFDVLAANTKIPTGTVESVIFPDGGADWLRYRLTLNTENPKRYWALLEVEDGQYPTGLLGGYPSKFYTEFYYTGR